MKAASKLAQLIVLCVLSLALPTGQARAEAVAPTAGFRCGQPNEHGPGAARSAFPSHVFQLAPHTHPCPELSFHLGLLQPALFRGFNVALDLRVGRLLVSYSHGQGLDYSASPKAGLSEAEREAGVSLYSPFTTGGGIGLVLIDELYLMVDLKVHRYEAELDNDRADYTTVSLGGELGYRLFLWRGLFAQAAVRYWPNIYGTLGKKEAQLGSLRLEEKELGLFMNLMLGWAFDP